MFEFTPKGKPFRYTFYAPTIDDWYPNYVGNRVKISVFGLVSGRLITSLNEVAMFRIWICGGDDDYRALDREWTWQEAIDFANNEIKFPVSKAQLDELKFEV